MSGTCPPSFGRPKKISLAWTGNALKKKKGLFGEALILTTSHLVVLVIILYYK